jgi:hypothetical protein
MARFGDLDTQYFDDAGNPLVNGKVYFYESGTTTLKNTFADVNLSIPNTNPVILTAAGRQPNIFFDGVAKAILTSNSDVQILVRDPVGETATDFGDEWVATKIYGANDVVLGSDGVYYRSLVSGNQNNNPVSTTNFWTLLYSVEWNAGITYQVGAVVTYDGEQYQSLQGSNLNQNPSTASSYWVLLSFAWLATATYAEDQNAVGTDGILYTSLQNGNIGNDPATSPAYWVGTSAAAAASAVAAAASAAAALVSENAAAADAIATAADVVQTGLDAAATAADAIATAADRVQTGLDAAATAADVILTNADAVATAADRVQTGLDAAATSADAIATAADRVQTGLDVIATNADAIATAADAIATAADVVQTGLDVVATSADVVQTGLDVTAAAGSASAASGSASAAAASAAAAAASYDAFDDRYLGDKASDPTLDNDGNALLTGALYFNTTSDVMKVYDGSAWNIAAISSASPTFTGTVTADGLDINGTATLDGLTVQGTATTRPTIGNSNVNTSGLTTGLNFEPISNLSNGAKLNVISGLQPTVASAYTAGFEFVTQDHSGGGTFAQTKALTIGASGDISFYEDTGTTPKFFWDASAEGYATANVGIGTTSPSAALEVLNGSGNGEVAIFTGTDSDRGLSISTFAVSGFGQTGVDLNAQYSSAATMTFSTGSTERLRIDSSGNVGIGTGGFNVLQKLHISTGTDSDAGTIAIGLGQITDGSRKATFTKNTTSPFELTIKSSLGGTPTPIIFEQSATQEAMRIDSSGNVGIGTSSPAFSEGSGLEIERNSASATLRLQRLNTNASGLEIQARSSEVRFQEIVGSAPMTFYTGGSEKMRIDASGNVGIGTTSSPANTLEVRGEGIVRIRPSADSTQGALYLNDNVNSGSSYRADIAAIANGGLSFKTIGSINTVPTERLRIDSSGKVRINTTNTTSAGLFQVKHSTDKNLAITSVGSGVGLAAINDLASSNAVMGFNASLYEFQIGGTERLRIDSSGRVGIGTSSPAAKLHLKDETPTAVQLLQLESGWNNPSGNKSIEWTDATNTLGRISVDYTAPKASMRFGSLYNSGYQTGDVMTLTGDGNVGIGTSSPAYKLDVAKSDNTVVNVGITNANTGTSAQTRLRLNNSGSNFGTITHTGSSFTTSGIYRQDGTYVYSNGAGGLSLITAASQPIYFATSNTERMRIDSSGDVFFGKTSGGEDINGTVLINNGRFGFTTETYGWFSKTGSNGELIRFAKGTTTAVGSISVTASTTAYNTSSDQRLKENIADADDAGSKVDAIQVRQFDWKADGSHQDYGMVAQELMTVAPEAVSVSEDPEDMMGVDYSKLVPMLIKEIQSLRNRVATLEGN